LWKTFLLTDFAPPSPAGLLIGVTTTQVYARFSENPLLRLEASNSFNRIPLAQSGDLKPRQRWRGFLLGWSGGKLRLNVLGANLTGIALLTAAAGDLLTAYSSPIANSGAQIGGSSYVGRPLQTMYEAYLNFTASGGVRPVGRSRFLQQMQQHAKGNGFKVVTRTLENGSPGVGFCGLTLRGARGEMRAG
jgi:hypothetical protein